MRRISLLLATVFFFGINCFAQNDGKVKGLTNSVAKSDEAIQDSKKSINPKTWMDRGKLFTDIYGFNTDYLRFGMPTSEAKLYFQDPKNIATSEENGVLKEVYEYSRLKLTFINGTLSSWEETQTIVNDPLTEAIKSFQKATSLDEKDKNKKKINDAYKVIGNDLGTRAYNEYNRREYKKAYQTALQKIEVSNLMGYADTAYYYFAGFVAFDQSTIDSSMWKEAVVNLEKALSLGFKESGDDVGRIYIRLYQANMFSGNSDKALKYAQEGFEKYPDNVGVIFLLINYYLEREESAEALKYVEKAKAKDPKNAVLPFAEGILYEKLGEKEKALSAYDAAIKLDPNKFDPYYNKAVVYYNAAVLMMDEANREKTTEAFEKKRDLAEAEFMRAIAPMEKAHELNPAQRDIAETLKSLYYRLKTKHPELESKYNAIVKELETL